MFRLTSKLQVVKASLKNWQKTNRSHISSRVLKAKTNWEEAQGRLEGDPWSEDTMFLKRRATTNYQRRMRNKIACLVDGEGNMIHNQKDLEKLVVDYYKCLMTKETRDEEGSHDYGIFPKPIRRA
ncbi:hypothetical protein OIU84_012654 [Salix udensis]|uniref:Uncharacterized protein n=1 Tax=Salix udensis TaxID=889485 RepID=A0AAD6JI67_9ROSI|nr:hypothetical protein OIU84_012654 [Salix udensis]